MIAFVYFWIQLTEYKIQFIAPAIYKILILVALCASFIDLSMQLDSSLSSNGLSALANERKLEICSLYELQSLIMHETLIEVRMIFWIIEIFD